MIIQGNYVVAFRNILLRTEWIIYCMLIPTDNTHMFHDY